MSDVFKNMTDILNLGHGTQSRLAELNGIVAERIRETDNAYVHRLFEELLELVAETDVSRMAAKEERLDALGRDLSAVCMELLKEAELMLAMRSANDSLLKRLREDIKKAEDHADTEECAAIPDAVSRADALRRRAAELRVTLNVGVGFSEQIRLHEKNLRSLAERIKDVALNLIPLLRGRISAEHSRILISEIKEMMV
ncbi:MAG: hypothetical protein K5686_09710 [Lachnospiraceae bacterium]|nr:hypothetical protein [Lachnospiraceae bacterium]